MKNPIFIVVLIAGALGLLAVVRLFAVRLHQQSNAVPVSAKPDIAEPEASVSADQFNLGNAIEQLLDGLPEREAAVIRLRYGLVDGKIRTLEEIAQILGTTRDRVRQIESKTMSKLRHPDRSSVLRDLLDN